MAALGRVVAVILMVCCVVIFGSLVYISSIFVQDDSEREAREAHAQRDMTRALCYEVRELGAGFRRLTRGWTIQWRPPKVQAARAAIGSRSKVPVIRIC